MKKQLFFALFLFFSIINSTVYSQTGSTCNTPTTLSVTYSTTTTSELNWVNANISDSKWDILLIAATDYIVPPTPSENPALGSKDKLYTAITTSSPFSAIGLQPATIYYYYIRTICSDTEKSIWSTPNSV